MVVPAVAQPQESCECMYAPQKGQFQVNLGFGQGQVFNDFNGLYYLLPNADGTSLGLGFLPANYKEVAGLGNNYISADLSTYAINIGSLNLNDLTNIAGVKEDIVAMLSGQELGIKLGGFDTTAKELQATRNLILSALTILGFLSYYTPPEYAKMYKQLGVDPIPKILKIPNKEIALEFENILTDMKVCKK